MRSQQKCQYFALNQFLKINTSLLPYSVVQSCSCWIAVSCNVYRCIQKMQNTSSIKQIALAVSQCSFLYLDFFFFYMKCCEVLVPLKSMAKQVNVISQAFIHCSRIWKINVAIISRIFKPKITVLLP